MGNETSDAIKPDKFKFFLKRTDLLSRFFSISTLLIVSGTFSMACQHARVIVPPPVPVACRAPQTSDRAIRLCEVMKQKQNDEIAARSDKRETKIIPQRYYLWGFYPMKMEYYASQYCPQGIHEIHQFTTFKDGLYQNLTLGIVFPRTLEITCK